jgi:hypothetical protein
MADSIKLRDGSEVSDPRLARLRQFDERSRNFPIMATVGTTKQPRSYTWRCDQYLDQGSEGACVGFSMTHELAARPAEVKHLSAPFAREQVYWEAQKIDPWPGGAYPGAEGQYEGTSVLAGAKMLKRLGYIDAYRWAFGLDDLVMAVGYKGPAVLGVAWYEGMFDIAACGHLHIIGQMAGGHAIMCKGVNVKDKTFTLHNSWGPRWGNGGDALIHWDEMDRLLHEQGEAVIPMGRHRPGILGALAKLVGR